MMHSMEPVNHVRIGHPSGIMTMVPEVKEEDGVLNLHSVGAVSYTHLDVYKRQIQGYVYSRPISADEFEAWREQYEK